MKYRNRLRNVLGGLSYLYLACLLAILLGACTSRDPYALDIQGGEGLKQDAELASAAAPGYRGESWLVLNHEKPVETAFLVGKQVVLPTKGAGVLVSSNADAVWQAKPLASLKADATKTVDIRFDLENARQTLGGWGGALNEKGWIALSALSQNLRDQVLAALFDANTGLGFSVCRIPIGANDYSESRYSLAETPNDWQLLDFSIERDRKNLLPYVKAAQKLNPGMKFWASAWSPPAWLKTNNKMDSGALRDEARVYETLALYHLKFVQAYKNEGIPITYVAVQNEPSILTAYPSCEWKPEQFRTYVGSYLGPLLAKEAPATGLMLGTLNMVENWEHIDAVLQDAKASPYVAAVGLQWDGNQAWERSEPYERELPLIQTETDCGNWHWKPGFNANFPTNDYAYALYTWRKMKTYLDLGVSVYELWNLILDETGKSIDSVRPWPQNSPVVVDTQAQIPVVHLTPMYFSFAQFAEFAPPGSKYLGSRSGEAMAFMRPDGRLALMLNNETAEEKTFRVDISGTRVELLCPPRSFNTAILAL